jgi:hypothetical protein
VWQDSQVPQLLLLPLLVQVAVVAVLETALVVQVVGVW